MMPLALGAVALPPLDTATKIWAYEQIDSWLQLGPTNWGLNLRKMNVGDLVSAVVEMYYLPNQVNAAGWTP